MITLMMMTLMMMTLMMMTLKITLMMITFFYYGDGSKEIFYLRLVLVTLVVLETRLVVMVIALTLFCRRKGWYSLHSYSRQDLSSW